MDNSYQQQSQTLGPFYFYNADSKSESHPHVFSEYSDENQGSMYHQQMHQQSMSSNSPFPRPDSSVSMPITPQGYQTAFPTNVAHINSSMYQKSHYVNQDQAPRLMIDSNIQESDLYCFPSTPPLSASASVMGSPFIYQGIPTPINQMFRIDNVKDNQISPENLPLTDWVGCASPPITPVFIHPNSLMSNSSEPLPPHCQFLSPSPTPFPPSASQQSNLDYCDPRNLTVLPVGQISQPMIKTAAPTAYSPVQASFTANEDEIKLSSCTGLHNESYAKNTCVSHIVPSAQPVYDQHADDFASGLINYSPPNSTKSLVFKRRRSNSTTDAISLYGESVNAVGELKISKDFEPFASACPPSPPLSISEGQSKSEQPVRKERKTRAFKNLPEIKIQLQSQGNPMSGKKSNNTTRGHNAQTGSFQSQNMSPDQQDAEDEDNIAPAPPTRRGRKESLTNDPSKTFGCAGCTRKFRRQEHMKRHFRSLHTKDRPFSCPECGKKFSRSDNLTQHSRTHGSGSSATKPKKPSESSGNDSRKLSGNDIMKSLGNTLYITAAATSGSESDLSQIDGSQRLPSEFNLQQTQKKRKRSG
ncbi:hypothetical protein K3495_g275 [Podosphaera aphanis]|nr:hypothetical protein K3495_g275 [Podosphaera aphanis]